MPVRILRAGVNGQAINTIYAKGYTPSWQAGQENTWRATGNADDFIEKASDYPVYQQYVFGQRQIANGEAPALAGLGVAQNETVITAASFTPANDPSMFYGMSSASAQTVTIAAGMTAFAIGATLSFVQLGAGAVTLVAGSGVTINKRAASLVSKGQYAIMQLLNVGVDNWIATGDFT